jgi:hypothetical protein
VRDSKWTEESFTTLARPATRAACCARDGIGLMGLGAAELFGLVGSLGRKCTAPPLSQVVPIQPEAHNAAAGTARRQSAAAPPPHPQPGFFAQALHQPAAAICLRPNIAQPPHSSLALPCQNEQFEQRCSAVCLG